MPDALLKEVVRRTPLARNGPALDVAKGVVFLASSGNLVYN